MKKDIDNMTGLYFSVQGNPYSAHPFPFNMKELREYLKKTGKTMKDLTVNEFDMFRVSPIAKANQSFLDVMAIIEKGRRYSG